MAAASCYDTVYLRRLPVVRGDEEEDDHEQQQGDHRVGDDDDEDTVLLSHPLLHEDP